MTTGSDLDLSCIVGFAGRNSERHDGSIGIKRWRWRCRRTPELLANAHVLKCAGVARRVSKLARKRLAAFNDGFAPHIFFHPVRWRNPRAAGFAPTGRAC